jgi:hypothetical protein
MTTLINPPSESGESASGALTDPEFHQLAAVPAEAEWFAHLDNPRTRRAYQNDLRDFMAFFGIQQPNEFRIVTRAHVLAWRKTSGGPSAVGGDDPAQARRVVIAVRVPV